MQDPFMGNQFPWNPDDDLRHFADSSLNTIFDLPEEPFTPTTSAAQAKKMMYDTTREQSQAQAMRDALWRNIGLLDIIIGIKSRLAQILCRRIFLQVVKESITPHQASVYFHTFFGTHSFIYQRYCLLLSQGAVPFAQGSHRFEHYAREQLSRRDIYSEAADKLMLADKETKQDILTEMLWRRDMRKGTDAVDGCVRSGLFVVPRKALPAEFADLLRRLELSRLPFNSALQLVMLFVRV